ncbi:MAG TPA: TRAM domain-containing protein [Candidatus Saccharimonadales bacterium]
MNETTIIITLAVIALLQLATLFNLKERHPRQRRASVVLDTCALIDGRVKELVKTGFIDAQLIIPQRVIDELQYLADHGDAHKRSRARFGLDVVQDIQAIASSDVLILHDNLDRHMETDAALIDIANKQGAQLYTTDYNLNKVARIKGVSVLNVNELAHALRPLRLPGETIEVKIVQKGASNAQGVGYLEDGTMAVIENTSRRIGQKVTARVDRMLQTEAGKMVFAKLEGAKLATHTQPAQHKAQKPQPTKAAPPEQNEPQQPIKPKKLKPARRVYKSQNNNSTHFQAQIAKVKPQI